MLIENSFSGTCRSGGNVAPALKFPHLCAVAARLYDHTPPPAALLNVRLVPCRLLVTWNVIGDGKIKDAGMTTRYTILALFLMWIPHKKTNCSLLTGPVRLTSPIVRLRKMGKYLPDYSDWVIKCSILFILLGTNSQNKLHLTWCRILIKKFYVVITKGTFVNNMNLRIYGTHNASFCSQIPIIHSNNIKSNVKKGSMGLPSLPFSHYHFSVQYPEAIITPNVPRVINYCKINRTTPFKILFIPEYNIIFICVRARNRLYSAPYVSELIRNPAVVCCYRLFRMYFVQI